VLAKRLLLLIQSLSVNCNTKHLLSSALWIHTSP